MSKALRTTAIRITKETVEKTIAIVHNSRRRVNATVYSSATGTATAAERTKDFAGCGIGKFNFAD